MGVYFWGICDVCASVCVCVLLKWMRYWVAHLFSALWFQIEFEGSCRWDCLQVLKATSITIGCRAIDLEITPHADGQHILFGDTYNCTYPASVTSQEVQWACADKQHLSLLLWHFWGAINQTFQIHRSQTGEKRPKATRGSGPGMVTPDKNHNL